MNKKCEVTLDFRSFDSLAAADAADREELRAMSGNERLDLALEMMAQLYGTHQRLERVYRVVKRQELPISDNWRVGL